MSLFAKLRLVKLNQSRLNNNYSNRPFNKQQGVQPHRAQSDTAYFCEHDGICIKFTQAGFTNAKSSWHAITPCALKPWWLFLKPQQKK